MYGEVLILEIHPHFSRKSVIQPGNFTVGGWAAFASNGNPAGSENGFVRFL